MIATVHCLIVALSQAADDFDPEEGEFNLFLTCILLIGIAALCVLILVGIVIGLIAFAALTGIGVASITANAIVTGLICKSPKVGLNALTLQFGAAIGLFFGIAGCVATRWLLGYAPFDFVSLFVTGILFAALGASIAWISFSLVLACFRQIRSSIVTAGNPNAQIVHLEDKSHVHHHHV
ncbi:MAG: hypothetical protein ACOYMS_10245 [Terrimicrobiaceae bacterium]